jgi:hypothetical protein
MRGMHPPHLPTSLAFAVLFRACEQAKPPPSRKLRARSIRMLANGEAMPREYAEQGYGVFPNRRCT